MWSTVSTTAALVALFSVIDASYVAPHEPLHPDYYYQSEYCGKYGSYYDTVTPYEACPIEEPSECWTKCDAYEGCNSFAVHYESEYTECRIYTESAQEWYDASYTSEYGVHVYEKTCFVKDDSYYGDYPSRAQYYGYKGYGKKYNGYGKYHGDYYTVTKTYDGYYPEHTGDYEYDPDCEEGEYSSYYSTSTYDPTYYPTSTYESSTYEPTYEPTTTYEPTVEPTVTIVERDGYSYPNKAYKKPKYYPTKPTYAPKPYQPKSKPYQPKPKPYQPKPKPYHTPKPKPYEPKPYYPKTYKPKTYKPKPTYPAYPPQGYYPS